MHHLTYIFLPFNWNGSIPGVGHPQRTARQVSKLPCRAVAGCVN